MGPLAKPFLGGLFQVLRGTRPGQPRRLNVATRADLACWYSLHTYWLGVSTHQFLVLLQPDEHLFMDASGFWGAVLGFCLLGSKCPGLQTTVCHQLLKKKKTGTDGHAIPATRLWWPSSILCMPMTRWPAICCVVLRVVRPCMTFA